MRIWLLWLHSRWQGLGAAAIAVLALLLIALTHWGGPALSIRLLGNADAPRVAAQGPSGTILPRSSDVDASPSTLSDPTSSILDTPARADAGPRTVAAAQAAWSADEITKHQKALLSAINCARREQHQKAVILDPKLSEFAGAAWLRLVHDPSFSLMQLPGQYAMRSVLPFSAGAPGAAVASGQAAPSQTEAPACGVDGFDTTVLPAASGATQIGVAVFPPQASWDMPSAVILMH